MADVALDSGGVPRMTEKDEIRLAHAAGGSKRRGVGRLPGQATDERPVREHRTMAAQTLGYGRKPGALGLPRSGVACNAAKLQSGVTLVREGNLSRSGRNHHGSEKATKWSVYSRLYLFPPPAAMTTNCLPVLRPRNVMGVA